MKINLTIPAVPVAQPRQRHALIAGHVRNYTPTTHPVTAFKATCRMAAQQAYQGAPLEGPLHLSATFVLPRRKAAPKRTSGRLPHDRKPDIENLAKSLLDALTGLLWLDDRQIAYANLVKWEAAVDEAPHVVVTVVPWFAGWDTCLVIDSTGDPRVMP